MSRKETNMRSKSLQYRVLFLIVLLFFSCNQKSEYKNTDSSSVQSDLTRRKHESKALHLLQQEFLDLRFGMFIHFNIATYANEDWPDPNLSPEVFNPVKLDCNQWADVAVSANMTYGCLTAKHSTGFCLWDTQTTDYSVMNSPFKRDVVKEYAEAFRKQGLKVFLYYSILDLRHNIRRGWTKNEHTKFIKNQLTELLTNYGEITCLVTDSWDAGLSRDSKIMDLGNDDRFGTDWRSHKSVEQPYFEVIFDNTIDFNMVCIAEPIAQKEWYQNTTRIKKYTLQYWREENWQTIKPDYSAEAVKIHRFETVRSNNIRFQIEECDPEPAISEFMVYHEKR